MRLDFHAIKEAGVDPSSIGFSFTPLPATRELYFYITECGHYFCNRNYATKRDYYSPILVLCVYDGIMTVEYRNHIYHLGKGDVMLMDCREAHYYYASSDKMEFMFVHFEGSNAHEICQHLLNANGCLIRNSNAVMIRNLVRDAIYFFVEEKVESTAEASLRVYTLLTYLQQDSVFDRRELTPVEKAVEYVNSHISSKISLHDLAEAANLSDYYFSRHFKAATGISPIEYVAAKKLDYAKSLLIRTSGTTTEIAAQVGYSTRSFINLFTAHFGYPPQKFRQIMQASAAPLPIDLGRFIPEK